MPYIDFKDEWRSGVIGWVSRTIAINELWLYGARAKGTSQPDSDVDLAVSLMPARAGYDWALNDYLALSPDWQRSLRAIVHKPVNLTAILPGALNDTEVRKTGLLLWGRTGRRFAEH